MKKLTSKHPLPKYLIAAGTFAAGAATAFEAQAATFYVNSQADFNIDDPSEKQNAISNTNHCTLREALQNAFDLANGNSVTFPGVGCTPVGSHNPSGNTISFQNFPAGGVISIDVDQGQNPFNISANLIIDGFHADLSRPTVSGAQKSRVFKISTAKDVIFRNLHVTQGMVDPNAGIGTGAGLLVESSGGTTAIEECLFSENTALNGGALFITGGDTSIWKSEFVGNKATNRGGAIGGSGNPLLITQSKFDSNSAAGGGAIFIPSGQAIVQIYEGEFTANEASGELKLADGIDYNGGGAIMADSEILVDSTLFESNKVIGNLAQNKPIGGGAVYIGPSLVSKTAVLRNSSFVNNTAAFAEDELTYDPVTNEVESLKREACGGAIYTAGRTKIDRCNISENSAKCAMGGGGVFVSTSSSSKVVTISNTQFDQNAAFQGGIVLPKFGLIHKGGARGFGGALSVAMDATTVSVVNSTFKDDYGKSEVASLVGAKLYLKNNVFASLNAKETCDKDSANKSIIFGFHDSSKIWANDNALGFNFESNEGPMSSAEPSCHSNIQNLGGWLSLPGSNVPPPGGTPIKFQTHAPKISFPGAGAACLDPDGANGKDLVGTVRSFDVCTVGALE